MRPWLCVKVFVDVTEILLGVAGDGQGTKIGNKNYGSPYKLIKAVKTVGTFYDLFMMILDNP